MQVLRRRRDEGPVRPERQADHQQSEIQAAFGRGRILKAPFLEHLLPRNLARRTQLFAIKGRSSQLVGQKRLEAPTHGGDVAHPRDPRGYVLRLDVEAAKQHQNENHWQNRGRGNLLAVRQR
eukprot:scaffold1459_cov260-Pinguiococcus_pyrenoidosus.AAC.18